MKAKRLTALALAALMAASTTSVALAINPGAGQDMGFFDNPNYRGQLYMKDEDGYIVPANDGDFAPGDSIYLQLDWNDAAKSADLKRYNAYGDWAVGKSWVEDIEIVYAKGDVITGENTSTVYTLQSGKITGWDTTKQYTTFKTTDADKLADLRTQMKGDTANFNAAVQVEKGTYTALGADGWIVDGKYYQTRSKAVSEAGFTTVSNYYNYDGANHRTLPAGWAVLPADGFIVTVTASNTDKVYTSLQKDQLLKDLGFTKTTITAVEGEHFYVDAAETKYGSYSVDSGTVDLKTDKGATEVYVDVTNKKFIFADSLASATVDVFNSILTGATVSNTTDKGEECYYIVANATAGKSNTPDESYGSSNANALYVKKTAIDKTGGYAIGSGTIYENEEKAADTLTKSSNAFYVKSVADGAEAIPAANLDSVARTTVNALIDGITDAAGDLAANFVVVPQNRLGAPTGSFHPSVQHTTGYTYWVKIDTKDSTTTKDIDVVGSISVGTTKSNADKWPSLSMGVSLTNQNNQNSGDYTNVDSDIYIEPGERAVVSFADDASDEFEVEFGDDARFVFNARGQGKLNLAYNTKYNKDFAYDYDDANIDFITFEGEPTTNRTGTMYIYADRDTYIYEVTDRGAKSIAYLPAGGTGAVSAKTAAGKINGAYYDKDEDAWVFRTRHLTSYAISDKKLKTVDQMENGSSSSSGSNSGSNNNNGKPNPDTGR